MRTLNAFTLAAVLVVGMSGYASEHNVAFAGGSESARLAERPLRPDPIEKLARPRPDRLRDIDRRALPGSTNSLGQQVPSLTLPAPDNPAGAGHRRE